MIITENVRNTIKGVYLGRKNVRWGFEASPLANPWRAANEAERAAVIARYRVWLLEQLAKEDSPQAVEFRRLTDLARSGNLTLLCWCKPRDCHIDVVKDLIEAVLVLEG